MKIHPFEFDFTGFSFNKYYEGESKLLTPQLIKAGFIVGDWFSVEQDRFGPLVRGVKVTKDNKSYLVTYG